LKCSDLYTLRTGQSKHSCNTAGFGLSMGAVLSFMKGVLQTRSTEQRPGYRACVLVVVVVVVVFVVVMFCIHTLL
jgi:uncharacterized membrane protein YidH (DUF202 family)